MYRSNANIAGYRDRGGAPPDWIVGYRTSVDGRCMVMRCRVGYSGVVSPEWSLHRAADSTRFRPVLSRFLTRFTVVRALFLSQMGIYGSLPTPFFTTVG